MTKEELWKIYITKNPSFEGDGKVTMPAKQLKKFFDQTYDAGYEQRGIEEKSHHYNCKDNRKNENKMPDMFKDIFKGFQ